MWKAHTGSLITRYLGFLVFIFEFYSQETCKPSNKPEDGGRTIHCLMDLAARDLLRSTPDCEKELKLLLRQTNIGEDWTVDPVLKKECQVGIYLCVNFFKVKFATVFSLNCNLYHFTD